MHIMCLLCGLTGVDKHKTKEITDAHPYLFKERAVTSS